MEHNFHTLFSPFELGPLKLKNRMVMAPMTRSRAIGNVPNNLMATYYAQRANAGLIITEGTSPSPNGLGYSRIPGAYSDAQTAAWREVAKAVHAKGGKIFMQLMHTGRMGHPLNLPEGAKIIAPSAIAAKGDMWTDQKGMQPMPVPEAINIDDIPSIISEYVHSAENAIKAGFDGVEIHGANGYLPMQFLSPGSNNRTDLYGGSHENRNRFLLEVIEATAAAIGSEKVGVRLSPFNKFNDITADEHEEEQYLALASGLGKMNIAYLHLLTFAMPHDLIGKMKHAFGGATILNAGYTAERAETDLSAGNAELISFGTLYIGNPDLAHRFQTGAALATADQSKYYTPGAEGYTDYPTA